MNVVTAELVNWDSSEVGLNNQLTKSIIDSYGGANWCRCDMLTSDVTTRAGIQEEQGRPREIKPTSTSRRCRVNKDVSRRDVATPLTRPLLTVTQEETNTDPTFLRS